MKKLLFSNINKIFYLKYVTKTEIQLLYNTN